VDHLKWDSGVYEEYLARLRKMNGCLDEEIQNLTAARTALLRQQPTSEDEAMTKILHKLETASRHLDAMNERIHRLREAVADSMEIFSDAERKITGMGTEMLYTKVARSAENRPRRPLFTPFDSPFSRGGVTPAWLRELAEREAGRL
jgi:chromosome segregation ATPase